MSNATQSYREVKRKANAGERIKIVKERCTFGHYRNGDVLQVTRTDSNGDAYFPVEKRTDNPDGIMFAGLDEYVVLEPTAAPTPTTANLPDLFAQFIRDNAPAVRSYLAEIDPVESAEAVVESTQPAPLTRAKVIEMARERVAELERIGRDDDERLEGSAKFRGSWYEIDFVVNRDKRAVTALVYELNGFSYARKHRKPDAVGIAKCAPDDVFNADIGKAIAAERALGLTLTDAFVNAPKPTEKVAGMIVNRSGHPYKLVTRDELVIDDNTATILSYTGIRGTVIDDTDADYAQEAGEAA
ncbi:hypothetical protein [Paenibacillus sp. ACRRY]|uniref:hypothetical protein n=1 Tax=Paenibacillus sp. ACRRY TaxID=2918208 RepID=UPI001EF61C22|nr:hypothetical protein [Paenibacillus sp. ACRRY]MCG7383362.1 hypothetical protein [Paenibacillus sp. ACRRY]